MITKILTTYLLLITISSSKSKAISKNLYIEPNFHLKFSFQNDSDESSELKTSKYANLTGQEKFALHHHSAMNNSGFRHYIKIYKTFNSTKVDKLYGKGKHQFELLKSIYTNSGYLLPGSITQFECPNQQEISPCICSTTNKSLNCSAVNSFIQLKEILNTVQFPSKKFNKFTYYSPQPNDEEAVLLNGTFGPLSFNQILIGDSGMQEVEPQALSGSEDTLTYFLSDNNKQLKIFPFQDVLNNYKILKLLSLTKGSLTEIPTLSSASLQYLDLNSNNISKIGYDALQNLPSLADLDLSYNSLEELGPRGWSIGSSSFIFVNNNKLMDTAAFTNFQPKYLDQSKNYLTSFQEAVYKPILDSSYYVDVTGNNISCSELEWATGDPTYEPYLISDCTS